ncbi:MAG: hypothetical protein U0401_28755 [Anaerolineae bacterium]
MWRRVQRRHFIDYHYGEAKRTLASRLRAKYQLPSEVVTQARHPAEETSSVITVTNDPVEAVTGADIIHTDEVRDQHAGQGAKRPSD